MSKPRKDELLKTPEYRGGMAALKEFIKSNLKYPKEALDYKVGGTVEVAYDVDGLGKIRNVKIIAFTTIIFGILLFISDKFKLEKNIDNNFTFKSVIFIGFFQILSLVPGVSRSGIAITAARLLNFKRGESARISFLISIPILGAVSLFGIKNLIFSESLSFTYLNLLSIIVSFFFSLITIKYFLSYINKFSLNIFLYYRVLLGIILIVIAFIPILFGHRLLPCLPIQSILVIAVIAPILARQA